MSHSTQQAFDALNRAQTLTDADNNDATFSYDANDRLTSVTDQRGLTTTYTYDAFGNLTEQNSPDTGITTYTHDDAGNIVSKTDARGVVSNYTYDAINRLLTVSYPASPSENVTYSYDSTADGNKGIGRVTGITNNSSSLSFKYDERGNTIEVVQTIGSDQYVTVYAYDAANNVIQLSYPSGRIVNYSRDAVGQITTVTTQRDGSAPIESVATGISYLPFGGISALTYGNGVQTTQSYDQDYRLTAIDTIGSGTVQGKLYSYDLANNVTGINDSANSALSQSFSYDSLYRLTQEVGTYGTKTYIYDAVGNRTQRTTDTVDGQGQPTTTNQTLTYAPDTNRLIDQDNKATVMDANGNTISAQDAQKEFQYNNANRLIRFVEDSVVKADYAYNALGQRGQKLKHDSSSTDTFHYFYDLNGQMLSIRAAYTDGSSAEFDHIWLNNTPLVGHKTPYDANGSVSSSELQTTWLHVDHLNTSRVGTSDNQTIVWRWDSDAFGSGSVDNDPDGDGIKHHVSLRFPGQVKDLESGLHYNYFRDYDPALGRYMQSDPIGLRGGFNTYSYVGNRPANFADPLGLWSVSFDAYAGIGGGISFGQNNRTGEWFGGGRLGFGVGGGANLDLLDNGPTDRDLRPSPYSNSCNKLTPGSSGTSVGAFTNLGFSAGPYGFSYGAEGGRHYDGTGASYSNGPGPNKNVNGFGGKGLSFGGATGIAIYGW